MFALLLAMVLSAAFLWVGQRSLPAVKRRLSPPKFIEPATIGSISVVFALFGACGAAGDESPAQPTADTLVQVVTQFVVQSSASLPVKELVISKVDELRQALTERKKKA